MAVTIKPTAQEVIDEGQLKIDYFPTVKTESAFRTFIDSRIADVDAEVQITTGANYQTTSDNIALLLHKAEIYLTLGRLWQIITNVMVAFDEESLPPEFVSPEAAAANRDFYIKEGGEILARYESTDAPTGQWVRPYFGAAGVSEGS